jgi:hypothetical protein
MINLMVRFARPADTKPDAEGECDKCERVVGIDYALEIDLSEQTLCIGDEIPAGACPHCEDGLIYVYEQE